MRLYQVNAPGLYKLYEGFDGKLVGAKWVCLVWTEESPEPEIWGLDLDTNPLHAADELASFYIDRGIAVRRIQTYQLQASS